MKIQTHLFFRLVVILAFGMVVGEVSTFHRTPDTAGAAPFPPTQTREGLQTTFADRISGTAPTITDVSPTEAYNWQPTTVAITGTNFVATPTVRLNNASLGNVTLIDSTILTATVPADLPGGVYTITVSNQDNQSASLANAFQVLRSGDGSLGAWHVVSTMITPRGGLESIEANGYIYAIGGFDGYSNTYNSVERATINNDGSLSSWQATTSMNSPRQRPGAVEANGSIYVLGGYDGSYYGFLNSVERAVINSDGSLSSWQLMTPMTTPRYGLEAVAFNGYLYALGGETEFDVVAIVERAVINSDGSLGTWEIVSSMTTPRFGFGALEIGNFLYAIGGRGGTGTPSSVERALINDDGSLDSWQLVSSMTARRDRVSSVAVAGYIFTVGGVGEGAEWHNDVERAIVNSDGSLGSWQIINSMTRSRYSSGVIEKDGYIYTIGGFDPYDPLDSVEKADFSAPMMTAISPISIPAAYSSTIVISGTNFLPVPELTLGKTFTLNTNFISTRTLTTTVPSGLASGWYTATLTSGDGRVAKLANALRVESIQPIAGDLTINGGALSTTALTVTLGLSATDASDNAEDLSMSFSNDSSTWNEWLSYTTKATWAVETGDGEKTVYARFKDPAGNISNVVSDTIDLDSAASSDYGLTINGGALFTNQISVTLTIGSSPGTAQMQVSNDGGFAAAEWEPYDSRKAWTITQYGSYVLPRVVYVRYKDTEGSMSATYLDDIILDVTAPSGSVEVVPSASGSSSFADEPETSTTPAEVGSAINNYAYTLYLPLTTNKLCRLPAIEPANYTLTLSAEDDVSGVGYMMISNREDFYCATWESYTTEKAWYVTEGTSTVYVKFRDNAGNVSDVVTGDVPTP